MAETDPAKIGNIVNDHNLCVAIVDLTDAKVDQGVAEALHKAITTAGKGHRGYADRNVDVLVVPERNMAVVIGRTSIDKSKFTINGC